MSSQSRVQEFISTHLTDTRFVVVSNREPYVHSYNSRGAVTCSRPTSGMVTALDPVLQASCGTWIAHGSGDADFAVAGGSGVVPVPPAEPKYLLRRIRLSPEQERGYYQGFSNEALWPLCHIAHTRPRFERGHWEAYQQVNELFAREVHRAVRDARAFVFVQDYHLALLPQMVKERCPNATVAHFWHIPWPSPDILKICPWKRELVRGLLGSDLIGFHLADYCDNFAAGARSLFPHVKRAGRSALRGWGRSTRVLPFPVGIDFEQVDALAASDDVQRRMERFRARYRLPRWLGVGVDRLDYIKGIPERIRAISRLLEISPELRGQFTFIQVAVPSRTELGPYQRLDEEVRQLVREVNERFGNTDWQPVILISANLELADVVALYRLADVCLVSSLHDGMNLVAEEFVASRTDEGGALLLSQFAGAYRLLEHALMLNPYDTEGMAEQILRALSMPPAETFTRMAAMRANLRRKNIYRWMLDILSAAAACEPPRAQESPERVAQPAQRQPQAAALSATAAENGAVRSRIA